MTRLQWMILLAAALLLALWGAWRYLQTASALSEPLGVASSPAVRLPDPSPQLGSLLALPRSAFEPLSTPGLWGIVPRVDPKNPTPDAVIFTPAAGTKPARVCVGISCFEFMGLSGKKALFYDTNVSAQKKMLTLGGGSKLFKTLRVQKVSPGSVVLHDTRTKTTYEIGQFQIDLEPYKPKTDPAKGNPKK